MENSQPIKHEIAIVSAIKAGNEQAFELFYRAEYSNLKYFVARYIKDFTIAEDVVHDTFLKIWENRDKINPDQNLKAYLFTIARNSTINILRNKVYKLTDSIEKSDISFKITILNNEYMTSKIDALDMERIIEQTYKLLPEKIKETFILSRKNGLSYKEISEKLEISVKTVEHNVSAALKIFRNKLGRFIQILIFFMG